jgi:hypothetical protein
MNHSIQPESVFFLSDVMNEHAFLNGKEIGHVSDFVILARRR